MAETETKKRTGLGALADAGDADDFSVIDAIGGPRGVVESMLPGVVFVVMFVITSDLHLTIGVSAALAVLQVIVRLCQRQSVMGAVSGLLAVGICLIWAWNSHEARNYYMFGFLTNAFYIVLLAISLMVRVPGLGLVDRCVLPTTGGAGAVVPVQPGRLARHCTSAHGHSVLGVGHLGVVPHRGHPHASA